ncbi:hypothetical protein FNH05_02045 [Amycolatopsis rhizosphaerae]|uniref:Uncharacterized protein n=1 Tax=Amycolatopsis rhizosphaerae TaxID=2053003 RepID=A0A558DLB6_9PSEU|nr:hypothetical protein [Amycolatopsis rhizosphaerae]TVT61806.1 hypothetical protein FNH05_02045 [Amycolatopsis rhizosphaerae]
MPESTGDARSSSGLARRVVTIVWAVVSGIEFVIWLLMSLISTSVKYPFWLWTIGIGGAALLLWWYFGPDRRTRQGTE